MSQKSFIFFSGVVFGFFFFFFFHFVLIEFRDVRDFVFLFTSEFQVLRLAASKKVMRYLLNE